MIATTKDYAEARSLQIAKGRFLGEADEDGATRNVAVLGAKMAEGLFPGEDPVGATVVLNKHAYTIVGVLGDESGADNRNGSIFIPLNTCKQRFGEKIFIRQGGKLVGEAVQLHEIVVTVRDASRVRSTADAIAQLLAKAHPSKDWAIEIGSPSK